MKKTLLFIFSLFTLSLLGQDGINYQGAATDANGDELTNQTISLRASIISGSANGNLEWEETHSTTTDQFGLFNVVIGQGTNTTNGATATFDDMDWGSADHYLKIEMDASGGTNYAMIGTTQMMSVPYALYAKSAGIDSAMLANMIGSSGGGMGGGCDYAFPDGIYGEPIMVNNFYSSPYVVPSGKNLYFQVICSSGGNVTNINGIPISMGESNFEEARGSALFVAKGGDVFSSNYNTSSINGVLINAIVEPITVNNFYSSPYVVPSGKNLYFQVICESGSNETNINGIPISMGESNSEKARGSALFVAKAVDVISSNYNTSSINGYLVDENYFANCGGGGSSSSASAVDSAMVAGMIGSSVGGMGGGCDLKYPDGLDGEVITWALPNNDYTVPAGKNLYITTYSGNGTGEYMKIDGKIITYGQSQLEEIIVVGSGSVLSTTSTDPSQWWATFNGFLIDAGVTPVTWALPNNDYTVPAGKNLYVTTYSGNGTGETMKIDGKIITYGQEFAEIIVVGSGSVLSTTSTDPSQWWANFNGYLVDENYFAGCGGGGGSSSSASAVDSAMVAGMIANDGGGGGSLEIDTIYYNLDQASSGFAGAHYFDTLDIAQDGFIFARSHVTPSGQTSNPNYCTFIIHYGFNFEEDSRLIGQETTNSRMIPVKQGMKLCLYSVLNNDSDLDLFFIPNNSGGGSSSSNGLPDGVNVGEMLYWNGTDWVLINPPNVITLADPVLTFCNGAPQWGPCYEIGGQGPGGGTVFYLDGNGGGLEVVLAVNTWTEWGCNNIFLGNTSTSFGDGLVNTNNIISSCSPFNNSASGCANHSSSGFSDWYMPSLDELNLLYTNLFSLFPGGPGGNNWPIALVSSSEIDANTVWGIWFSNLPAGTQSSVSKVGTGFEVWPIRTF